MELEEANEIIEQAQKESKEGHLDRAIELLLQIKKHSGELKVQYAWAQFSLGILYKELARFNEAEQAYKNVKREDSLEIYTRVQINLGLLFKQQGRFEEAEQAYKNVKREDSVEPYARVLFNLGILLKQQNRIEEAIQVFKNVKREDSVEAYARTQYSLGGLFKDKKQFDEAEEAYKNIKRSDSPIYYARAQINLGNLFDEQGFTKESECAYKKIKKEDSIEQYAWAQWNLYLLSGKNKYLKNIRLEYDLETYAEAQFLLGQFATILNKKNTFWEKIPKQSEQYRKESYQINVVANIVALGESKYKNQLYYIFEKVSDILKNVFVENDNEQSIAHYTNLTVSKLLLSKAESSNLFKLKSPLRLNTINLMNDPEEGVLINNLLQLDHRIRTQDTAFIACFTLHHDSLNQFRLYAKEKHEEASGLSLVLAKDFFATEHNAARIYEKSCLIAEIDEDEGNINKKQEKPKSGLSAMPLYRCIYFDPTSGLIKVAQREEWSFRREFKLGCDYPWYKENEVAEKKWGEYVAAIQKIERDVKASLEQLTKLICDINIEKLPPRESELLAEILLPLRYLIKHMAFKEEQECRIVYVTQIDNELTQYDEKINRVYIDYEPSVMEHLEKIYLAPKASGEKMVFEYLCVRGQAIRNGKDAVKVKISQNPFR